MTTPITFFAGLPHFARHLAPMYLALPPANRGAFHARGRARPVAESYGIEFINGPPQRQPLVCVASYEDHRTVAPSRTVLVNHGIGQTYQDPRGGGLHPCYSGGRDRERVILHLAPSERAAAIDREHNPWAKSVVIGPPAYLDPYIGHTLPTPAYDVAFTAHADIFVVPETKWAWPYYEKAVIDIIQSGRLKVLGHGHPRMDSWFQTFWDRHKVPYERDITRVIEQAAVFAFDNSSSGYEVAATGCPVVVLDAPHYRTNINHGLRFWEHADVGIRINDPVNLFGAIEAAQQDLPLVRKRREKIVSDVYSGLIDGKSTNRAVTALIELSETFDAN